MHSLRLLIAAAIVGFGIATGSAQVWTRDSSFTPELHNDVPALTNTYFTPAADGRVLAWGNFTHLSNGAFASRGLAYLHADGSPDTTFVSALTAADNVFAAAPLPNGMALAVVYHDGATSLMRFLANGQIDPNYATIAAVAPVTLTPLPDGRILVWADYLRLGGSLRSFIARLNADGTLDSSFYAVLPLTTGSVAAVAGTAGGKIYVSTISQSATVTAGPAGPGKLLRLNADGSIDGSFTAPDPSNAFTLLAVQPDGRLLAATSQSLTRFNSDGTNDSTFGVSIANLRQIERLLARPDGEIVLQAQVGIPLLLPSTVLLLSATGSVQHDLGATLASGDTVQIAAVANDNTIWVVHGLPQAVNEYPPAGQVETGANSTPTTPPSTSSEIVSDPGPLLPPVPPYVAAARARLARISADGASITSIDAGVLRRSSASIGQSFVDTSGRFVITGQFTDVNGEPRAGIARFAPSGALDISYAPTFGDATLGSILIFGPDGSAIATESILGTRGVDGLYRLTSQTIRLNADGSVDTGFATPVGHDLKWHAFGADGRILVSYFSPDNTSESNLHLVWLKSDGTVSSILPTRISGLMSWVVSPVITIPDIAASIGNATTAIGTVPAPLPTMPPMAASYANQIGFARPLADGHIAIGGVFTAINGTTVPGLARLNADGSVDSSYRPDLSGFTNGVYSSTADSLGRVVISGQQWIDGAMVWSRRRLLADGSRDPAYYDIPNLTGTFSHWLDDGRPDLNFPTKIKQPDGTSVSVFGTYDAPGGIVWTTQPFARFIASDSATITVPPADQSVIAGHSATFLVGIGSRDVATYQWLFEGSPIAGATLPVLQINEVQATQAGHYSVRVTVDGQTLTSSSAALTVVGGKSRVVNFSAMATTAPDVPPIAGFVIGGNGAMRTWLIRTTGPSLTPFGISGTVPDPELSLFNGGTLVGHNAGSAADPGIIYWANTVGAFPVTTSPWFIPGWKSKESALALALPTGGYTAQVTSTSGASGTTLLEVYDTIAAGASGGLRNVSLRTKLGDNARTPILGFVIKGTEPMHILIRGVGPTLSNLGVPAPIPDPNLTVFSSKWSAPIATSTGWNDNADIAAAAKTVGTFALPPGSRDSAVVLTLDPGAYTTHLTSASGGSGQGMIEAYVLDPQ